MISKKVIWESAEDTYTTAYVVSTFRDFEWTDRARYSTKKDAIYYARSLVQDALDEDDIILPARVTKVVSDW